MHREIEGKSKDAFLITDALGASGLQREALALEAQSPARLKLQEELRQLRGTLHWEGNLDEMRRDQ